MPREYIGFLEGKLETPFGPMDFAITRGDHVSISAGSSSDKSPRIVVNRVPYSTHLHLSLQPDGSWIQKDNVDLYMSRGMGNDASRSAREKAYLGIKQAWEQFIAGDEGALLEAERGHLNNEIRSKEKDIEKAKAALNDLEVQMEELLSRELMVQDRQKELTREGGYPDPRDWSPRGEIPEGFEETEE